MGQAGPGFREPTSLERAFNRVFGVVVGLGLVPRGYYLLQVKGRKTGRVYSNPVSLVELRGVQFLVAPRGRTQWVRNVEASNAVVFTRGSSAKRCRLRPLADADKPPILHAYVEKYGAVVQRYFPVPAGSPPAAFAEIAGRYPVFEICAVEPGSRP